jgi:hypothetical protein
LRLNPIPAKPFLPCQFCAPATLPSTTQPTPAACAHCGTPDDFLLLTAEFRRRYPQEDREWQRDIRPKVEAYPLDAVK